MIVPKGKKVYFGARKFCEGEILPPHVMRHDINFGKSEPEKILDKYKKNNGKSKSQY